MPLGPAIRPVMCQPSSLVRVLRVALANGRMHVPRAAASVQALLLSLRDLAKDRLLFERAAVCGIPLVFLLCSAPEATAFATSSAKASASMGLIVQMATFTLAISLIPTAVSAAHLASAGAIMELTTRRECHSPPLIFHALWWLEC